MQLIPEWKKCLRMFSMQAMIVATAVQGAWVALPADWQETIPDTWVRVITMGVLALGAVGRLIAQPKVSGEQS